MSEVKVNKLSPRSGTTVTLGDSGDTISIPSGVTLDASSGGLAGTLTTAAQPNITQTGTLTSFASTGIDDNATSTAITIDSSENVAIGTATPNAITGYGALTIAGTTGGFLDFEHGSTLNSSIVGVSSGLNILTRINQPIIFKVNATEGMRLNSTGLGIGTTTPNRLLTLGGTSNARLALNASSYSDFTLTSDVYGFSIYDDDATAYRLTVKNNGNVGIGTTSPTATLNVETSNSAVAPNAEADDFFVESSGSTGITIGSGISSKSSLYFANSTDNDIAGIVVSHAEGSMRFNNNTSERMRITSSGNVGIGTTSPSTTLDVTGNVKITTTDNSDTLKLVSTDADAERGPVLVLHRDSGSPADNDVVGELQFAADSDAASETNFALLIGKALDVSHGFESGELDIQTRLSGTGRSRIKMNSTETVVNDNSVDLDFRVESNGISNMFVVDGGDDRVYINASSTISGANGYLQIQNNFPRTSIDTKSNTTAPHHAITFHNPNGQVGQINTDGSGVTFTSNSDYRLKENVNYDFDATTRLKQLKPARFNFKADTNKIVDGFIAHEVSSVVPEAIHGTKDAVDEDGNPQYQGIDQSKLVPLLVKTIQELEARITQLENN